MLGLRESLGESCAPGPCAWPGRLSRQRAPWEWRFGRGEVPHGLSRAGARPLGCLMGYSRPLHLAPLPRRQHSCPPVRFPWRFLTRHALRPPTPALVARRPAALWVRAHVAAGDARRCVAPPAPAPSASPSRCLLLEAAPLRLRTRAPRGLGNSCPCPWPQSPR